MTKIVGVSVLMFVALGASAKELLAVPWLNSPKLFAGRTVIVKLRNGTSIRGQWITVTVDSFEMSITKTSRKKVVPKGRQMLPRTQIQQVSIQRTGSYGRAIGTTAGFLACTFAFDLAALAADRQGGDPSIAAVLYGGLPCSVLGYWLGGKIDHSAARQVILVD